MHCTAVIINQSVTEKSEVYKAAFMKEIRKISSR